MYSIVIPIYNEQETLPEIYRRLKAVIDTLDAPSEIIFIDDGSSDQSSGIINEIHKSDSRIKLIRFSRNFGHQVAISAGIDFASGEVVILMDGDLQDPPEVIPNFIQKWREGFNVVFAIRTKRKENIFKRFAYFVFYRLLRKLSYLDIPLDAGDFCLMDRNVVKALKNLPERHRFVRGLRTWVGFKQVGLSYERDQRFAGKPKYTLAKLFGLAYDGLFAFSTTPLKLAVTIGFIFTIISLLGGLTIIYRKLVHDFDLIGWASIIVTLTFLGGLTLLILGIIGEYIGRIYDEVKHRPLYIIKDQIGFNNIESEIKNNNL
ncbi:MAG: glycosyltransferase family 2 protein [Nanoarchaeota archaeon]|nr:glycosyltransferase family 2 protein [Nanoarchaeota archaeon]